MRIKEGRRIKSDFPMNAVMPFIMPTRVGSSNTFFASANIKNSETLIRKLKTDGFKGIGMMHIFIAAYARVVSQYPGINRFIRGQRLYARNEIDVCLTIKKELKLNAPETVIKLNIAPDDTLDVIYHKINNEIEANRKDGDQNNMDTAARVLVSLPGFFLRFIVGVLRFLDYFGFLPRFLTKLSPFHGSMFITNMGSLGMPPIVHHLYNFGILPVFIAMGAKRKEYSVTKDGSVEENKLIDFTVVCDERICDGHYYATAFKSFKKLLECPELLLSKPEAIVEDIR